MSWGYLRTPLIPNERCARVVAGKLHRAALAGAIAEAEAPASQSKIVGVEIHRRKSLLFPGDDENTVAQPPKIRKLESLRRTELDLSLLRRLRTLYLAPGRARSPGERAPRRDLLDRRRQ